MLSFVDVQLSFAKRKILDGVSFTIYPGQKVGLTGPNGAGKTTMLRLMRRRLEPDEGTVSLPRDIVIAHVEQEYVLDQRPIIEHVLDGDAELRQLEASIAEADARGDGAALGELHGALEAIGGLVARSRAARLLAGLGFASEEVEYPASRFSGGWQMRVNLARALMCRSDLLLLDEPSNHLDLDAIVWLEQWLRRYDGTLVLISHDRDFLDPVVDKVLRLEHGKTKLYNGNYSAYERQHAEHLARTQVMFVRQQRQIEHMQAFVNRFRAKATKARQAQSRLRALEKMEQIAPAHVDNAFEFRFRAPEKLPRPLLRLADAGTGYGENLLLAGINMTLSPGTRVGLLGANGAGKSTFLRLLAGELQPLEGEFERSQLLEVGYFAQHRLEQLDTSLTPYESLAKIDPGANDQVVRDFLGGFGFSGDRVHERTAHFSGGEKARLTLALVLYGRPNLLLLDEPSNHLDLTMRHALGAALQTFEGAVVLVSHDRHLIRVVCDELWLCASGSVTELDGDLDDYLADLARRGREANDSLSAPRGSGSAKKARRQAAAAQRDASKSLRAAVKKLEAEMEVLAGRRGEIEQVLATSEIYDAEHKERLESLLKEQGQIAKRQPQVEAEWLEAQERLEAAG